MTIDPEMPEEYATLRQRVDVDMLQLDEEIIHLPMLIQRAAEMAAEMEDEERQARHRLDIARAMAADRLRKPESGKAPSETQITTQLSNEDEVIEARYQHDKAQFRKALASALANSLRDKSRALSKICDLINSGYMTPNSAYAAERRKRYEGRPK